MGPWEVCRGITKELEDVRTAIAVNPRAPKMTTKRRPARHDVRVVVFVPPSSGREDSHPAA